MRAPLALALAGTMALSSGRAAADCTPPVPPPVAAKPAKPVPPARSPCVDAKPGTPDCMGWESYGYNDAVKAYNARIPAFQAAAQAYAAKLQDYVKASVAYAQCEADTLR